MKHSLINIISVSNSSKIQPNCSSYRSVREIQFLTKELDLKIKVPLTYTEHTHTPLIINTSTSYEFI